MATKDKYDRQKRLWGVEGQRRLEAAKICVLFSGPTSTESLKNLVLPGCGHITLVDDARVTEADVGNNFFVDAARLGEPRAQVALDLLLEMNPDVRGAVRLANPVELIESDLEFFAEFSVVVATQLPERPLRALGAFLFARDIPLVVARTYGLLGSVRVAVREHAIVESKPDAAVEDLRIANPFPALRAHAGTFDLTEIDDAVFGKVPYPVLLIRFMEEWKAAHEGLAPTSRADKTAFVAFLESKRRPQLDGAEENFDEAVTKVSRVYQATPIPGDVQDLLDDPKAAEVTPESSNFWVLVHALRRFVAVEGEGTSLPVTGAVSDMTATSDYYVALQRVYRAKAEEDLAAMRAHVDVALASVGRAPGSLPDEELQLFVKNAAALRVVRTRSLEDELGGESPSSAIEESVWELPEDRQDQAPFKWYAVLRAAERFYLEHGRYPGACDDADVPADVDALWTLVESLAPALGVPEGSLDKRYAEEVARYGACEPHAIAAIVGAVVGQEVVKLLTHQFVPINNTYLYNGIASIASTGAL